MNTLFADVEEKDAPPGTPVIVFDVLQDNFVAALKGMAKIVPTSYTLPVLGFLLLDVYHNRINLSGTNLETAAVLTVGAEIPEENKQAAPIASICIPYNVLARFLKEADGNTLRFTILDNLKLHILIDPDTDRIAELTVNCIEADEFPVIPPISDETYSGVTMEPDDFKLLNSTVVPFALPPGDFTRPVLAGIEVVFDGGDAHYAATDGFRLALVTRPIYSTAKTPLSTILPASAVPVLVNLLKFSRPEELVKIHFLPSPGDSSRIVFDFDGGYFLVQTLNYSYPDYTPIIPDTDGQTSVTGDLALIENMARRAAALVASGSKNLSVSIHPVNTENEEAGEPEEPHLRIFASDTDVGRANNLDGFTYTGDEVADFGVNCDYFLDALNAVAAFGHKDKQVTIGQQKEAMPITVFAPGNEKRGLFVVMPIVFGR